jgi:Neuraminidase (sialidase)
MKRPTRSNDGLFHLHGKTYKELVGSRQQVWNKTAYKTPGGLTHPHLMMNKWGRIVSRTKHLTAKKEKRLQKAGYFAKKGKFGYVRKTAKRSSRSRK